MVDRSIQLPQHKFRQPVLDELAKTDLEWTRVHNGYFVDYFGAPHLESHLQPVSFGIDMANKAAGIPGTGNDVMCFTYTKDLAKFVVAALDLPKWDEAMFCYGDKITWNEFLKIAEEVRGQSTHLEILS
jgi:nucleoside-diphosphate-sugar epimerase